MTNEWQPISSLPKDSPEVLLYTACGVIEGYYKHGSWQQDVIYATYDGSGGTEFHCGPTHWMPLPPKPVD